MIPHKLLQSQKKMPYFDIFIITPSSQSSGNFLFLPDGFEKWLEFFEGKVRVYFEKLCVQVILLFRDLIAKTISAFVEGSMSNSRSFIACCMFGLIVGDGLFRVFLKFS